MGIRFVGALKCKHLGQLTELKKTNKKHPCCLNCKALLCGQKFCATCNVQKHQWENLDDRATQRLGMRAEKYTFYIKDKSLHVRHT